MKATKRAIAKSGLMVVVLALAGMAFDNPAEASGASDLKIEETCTTPAVFRPNEWVVTDCLDRVTNTGSQPLRDIVTSLTSASGVPVDGYFMLFAVDGNPLPVDPTGASFAAGGELAPGVTAEVHIVALVRLPREGTAEQVWATSVAGEAIPP
jgi:hypothetical protein